MKLLYFMPMLALLLSGLSFESYAAKDKKECPVKKEEMKKDKADMKK